MFIWDERDLNEEQTKAVLAEDSLLLIACPGSGKTRALTYKIAYELSRIQSEKQFIVAITYTNRAAEEIKERVELLGVDIRQLWIGTIHAFCLEWILRPYSLYLPELKHGFSVLNTHETEEILTELCKPYKKQKITYWDFMGYHAIPNGFIIPDLGEGKAALNIILENYHQIIKERGQIDFELILSYSYQLLQSKPIICRILSKIFPYILIDEYQDTKEIQYHIIGAVLRAGQGDSKVFIVGDPNQSIFEGLGGYPMNKQDLESLFGFSLKSEYTLQNNYRSSKIITEYFDYYKTFSNIVTSAGKLRDFESTITYNRVVSIDHFEEEISRLIVDSIENKGILPNEICICAPQWIPLAGLTRNLMAKLPDYSFDGPGMTPFSRDIENFWYRLSRIILTEPSPSLYIRRIRWSKEILNELSEAGVDVARITAKSLLHFCNSIEISETDGLTYLSVFFYHFCDYLKIDLSVYPGLFNHHESFFKSSTSRISTLREKNAEFVSDITTFRKVFKQKDGIKVSTIHGIKGTEFDTVIGFGLLEGLLPHFKDTNGDVNSKKMLYVLCSRARKHLHLISESGSNKNYYNNYEGMPPTSHLNGYDYPYTSS